MTVYDQAALSDEAMTALKEKVWAIIDKLPQRAVIDDKTARWWVDETCRLEGERAIWHAHRAGTIGGSEAGEFILYASGRSQAYQTPEDIWQSKMLLTLPMRPTLPMRRGTAMEDLANRVYLQMTGHKSVLGDDQVKAAFGQPHRQHRHIGGNPDEVVDAGEKRLVVDFKVRSELDEEGGISIINGCQLHWYGTLHEGNLQRLPDGYALAELDIPNGMIDDLMKKPPEAWDELARVIAKINRPGFGMKISYTSHKQGLADNLVALTRQFWDKYVMTGKPFIMAKPEKPAELTVADETSLQNSQDTFLLHKIAENVAKDKAAQARDTMTEIASKYELAKWPFESEGLSAGYSTKFVDDAAAKRLIHLGVDRSTLTKDKALDSGKPNVEAMQRTLEQHGLLGESHFVPEWNTRAIKAALREHDLPASQFEQKTFRIGITKKKDDAPTVQRLQDQMAEHLTGFMSTDGDTPKNRSDVSMSIDDPELQDSLNLA